MGCEWVKRIDPDHVKITPYYGVFDIVPIGGIRNWTGVPFSHALQYRQEQWGSVRRKPATELYPHGHHVDLRELRDLSPLKHEARVGFCPALPIGIAAWIDKAAPL